MGVKDWFSGTGGGEVSLDTFSDMLDELASELPVCFYEKLNGGVVVSEAANPHPKARNNDLYVLGEYYNDYQMGRYIVMYYGSFMRLFPHAAPEKLKTEMRKTLRHEFRHHMESLAGERDLEIEDEEALRRYLSDEREVFRIRNRRRISRSDVTGDLIFLRREGDENCRRAAWNIGQLIMENNAYAALKIRVIEREKEPELYLLYRPQELPAFCLGNEFLGEGVWKIHDLRRILDRALQNKEQNKEKNKQGES